MVSYSYRLVACPQKYVLKCGLIASNVYLREASVVEKRLRLVLCVQLFVERHETRQEGGKDLYLYFFGLSDMHLVRVIDFRAVSTRERFSHFYTVA